ncbi:MAG TPA: hypothetical protein VNZ45_02690 [Bacteroidia bacterium]|jgi:hypothetical protein|nr:hypothetical protein [Bacteroidia bacterium]
MKKSIPLFLILLAIASCSNAQSKLKTDTMTLIDAQRSMNYRYMEFKKKSGDSLYSTLFDTCIVKPNKWENLWDDGGPPVPLKKKFMNKRFAVTYILDSIPMSENSVLGAVISGMVLIK